jgi:tRNA uridine 5-carboxymethylaminomethyl modification enzyme
LLEKMLRSQRIWLWKIKSMSLKQSKIIKNRPVFISASRISGVSPSDVSVLLIYMGR